MITDITRYINFAGDKPVVKEPSIGLSMPIIGKQNAEHAKWAINAIARTLTSAVKEYNIPATVGHFLSPRYPYDLIIRPLPGAIFKPAGINSVFWTNTTSRKDALYWSREFNGWRSWPRKNPDKAMSLDRWIDLQRPYEQAQAWLAVTTRAISETGSLFCCWAPMSEVMQLHALLPKLPATYLATCPTMAYDTKTECFDISPELLGMILGVKGWAA
jgi:hypothetical protein